GEKPAIKLQIEYHRIEIISGVFRPTRSASQPDAVAPRSRSHSVTANTAVTAVKGTPNSCEIGSMINKKIVKSKESRVQPSHAAHQAVHWSFVGSFHHGTDSARAVPNVMLPPSLRFLALPPVPALRTNQTLGGPARAVKPFLLLDDPEVSDALEFWQHSASD